MSSSRLPRRRWLRWAVPFGVVVAALAVTGGVGAQGQCPKGLDACLFVNGRADSDARDDVLTLREALLVTQNLLAVDELSPAEQAQVVLQYPAGRSNGGAVPDTPPGFGGPGGIGSTGVYFDTTVFCDGCPGNTIVLTPPGFGGPGGIGGYGGSKVLALPPLADPLATSAAGASKWVERIGGGYVPGVGEVPATVILDGSQLVDNDHAGLWVGSRGVVLRGLSLRNFPGTAVELECKVADGVTLDAVTFLDNGLDIATVGCPASPSRAR